MTTAQVNDTIVSLLEAKGWHPSVGRAFCMGLEKSGRFTEVRDVVCSVKKIRVFAPRHFTDLEHPDRLSVTSRRVLSRSGRAKFYPPYKMTRHELLLFMARYPEVEVIYKSSKLDNAHAYHANSRLVGTEILLTYVREHASVHGGDPTSLTDLGGNETYHSSRGRSVHCDAPITDARDKARYMHRDVYGGSDASRRCSFPFAECMHKSDFAIGVHSTYGMSVADIAFGMSRRGIKAYFGLLTVPTNLGKLPDGEYLLDGTCVTVAGAKVSFTFPYDSSASYTHDKPDICDYLWSRRTLNVAGCTYIYRILSLRGDTVFHSVVLSSEYERVQGPPLYVVPPLSKYYITIPKLLATPLEVDAQPFDRMVLHAASARNFNQYDISSLYQYAKSLRMSITINSVVLSHGFASRPEDLVTMVIAAYSVAAAYKVESARFFKDVSGVLDEQRDSGFVGNLCYIATGSAKLVLGALATASGLASLYGVTSTLVDRLVDGLPYLKVSVTPYTLPEVKTVESTVLPPALSVGPVDANRPLLPPALPRGAESSGDVLTAWRRTVADTLSLAVVPVTGGPVSKRVYASYYLHNRGVYPSTRDFGPTPAKALALVHELDLPTYVDWSLPDFEHANPDAYRVLCDAATSEFFSAQTSKAVAPVKLSKYGDFVYDIAGTKRSFVVRGVGKYLLVVAPFRGYPVKSTTRFCIRYDYDLSAECTAFVGGPDESTAFADSLAGLVAVLGSTAVVNPPGSSPSGLSSTLYGPTPTYSTPEPPATAVDAVEAGLFEPEPVRHRSLSPAHSADQTAGSVHGSTGTSVYYPLPPHVPPSEAGHDAVGAWEDDLEPLPDVSDLPEGYNAVAEFMFMNRVLRDGIISACKSYYDLALAVNNGVATARSSWYSLAAATPSQPTIVEVRDGALWDVMAKAPATHSGVYWDSDLLSSKRFLETQSEGTITVTCDELEVFVVDGLYATAMEYERVDYSCPSIVRDGVASAGKTYYILQNAEPGDYVVCETKPALEELRDGLLKKHPSMTDRAFTVDSALHNKRVVDSVDTLWIDEALRLHSAKVYLLVRMLKPKRVVAFGDSQQIKPSTFMQGYNYTYYEFPYDEVEIISEARTVLPCFAMVLSSDKFYDRFVTTFSKEVYFPKIEVYEFSAVKAAASEYPDTIVVVYTKACMVNFRDSGIPNTMTIGKVQGKRYDHVIIVRHVTSSLVLFQDRYQSLVAVTRARKTVRYFTPSPSDDSVVAEMMRDCSRGHDRIIDHVVS